MVYRKQIAPPPLKALPSKSIVYGVPLSVRGSLAGAYLLGLLRWALGLFLVAFNGVRARSPGLGPLGSGAWSLARDSLGLFIWTRAGLYLWCCGAGLGLRGTS